MKFSSEDLFLVSGASSGIGRQTVLDIIKCGGSAIACARSTDKLQQLQQECACPERLFIEQKDFSENIGDLPRWLKGIAAKYGKLRGMVCAAGTARINPLRSVDPEEIKKLFDLNYFAPVFMAKGFADFRVHMPGNCSVVMVASASAERSDKGHVEYAGSKAALIASSISIGRELAEKMIRVNCISPSNVRTPLTEAAGEEYLQAQALAYPLGIGSVEDVSNMILFLLSEKSKWITCQNYTIDCGSK